VHADTDSVDRRMKRALNTYTAYSIGCALVWAVLLTGVRLGAGPEKFHTFVLVFLGWVIGWLSATIARAVYRPPMSSRPV
jgi:hypothetical protein